MSGLYARCENKQCNKLFECPNIFGGNGTGISITNSRTGPCPHCGHRYGLILDGKYDLTENVMSLKEGPLASWEALKEIAAIVKASVDAGESAEQTVSRAAQLLPFLGKYKQFAAGIAIPPLIWLVQQVAAIKLGQELTPTPVTQEQTSALIMQSEQRLLDAIEKMGTDKSEHKTEKPSLGLHPQGNPLFDKYPVTARKLADYERNRQYR